MPFTSDIRQFISRALADKIPFAVYRRPGSDVCVVTDDSRATFAVNLWNTPSSANVVIGRTASDHAAMPMPADSTSESQYAASLSRLIERLKVRGGKTVISKVTVGDAADVDWTEAAERLFDAFPQAFCHLYYTPQTGAWLGATPEVLLDVNADRHMSTMALAGTTAAGGGWDNKNRDEHMMVVRFITDCLQTIGADPVVSATGELRYGAIKHLYTPISAMLPTGVSVSDVLDVLSPTPAVAGYPRDASVAEINACEQHPRGCYAGYVAVTDAEGTHAYVNLRCVRFDTDGAYCVYAGGGITAASDPATEWAEAESKAAALINIINMSVKITL